MTYVGCGSPILYACEAETIKKENYSQHKLHFHKDLRRYGTCSVLVGRKANIKIKEKEKKECKIVLLK